MIEMMERHLRGEVNVNNSPYGTAPVRMRLYYSGMAIGLLLDEEKSALVVDLERVTFMDSTGLGVLVSALKRVREMNGELRVVCTRRAILRVLEITGLDKVLSLYSSLDEATSS